MPLTNHSHCWLGWKDYLSIQFLNVSCNHTLFDSLIKPGLEIDWNLLIVIQYWLLCNALCFPLLHWYLNCNTDTHKLCIGKYCCLLYIFSLISNIYNYWKLIYSPCHSEVPSWAQMLKWRPFSGNQRKKEFRRKILPLMPKQLSLCASPRRCTLKDLSRVERVAKPQLYVGQWALWNCKPFSTFQHASWIICVCAINLD